MAAGGTKRAICIGGATLDRTYRAHSVLRPGTSNPASASWSFGGVARNVAENLAKLGASVALLTLVGDDEGGRAIIDHLGRIGVETCHINVTPQHRTAEYVAISEPGGELALGIADMEILDQITVDHLGPVWPAITAARWVFADCNLPASVLAYLISERQRHDFKLAVDAVSVSKVLRLPPDLSGIDVLFLNGDEARSLVGDALLTGRDRAAAVTARGVGTVVETQGVDGVAVATSDLVLTLPAVPAEAVDVTGAGDALTAATLDALMRDVSVHDAARIGTLAAALTVESPDAVRSDLSQALLRSAMDRLDVTGILTRHNGHEP